MPCGRADVKNPGAIRSERALCREVQLNLAYRWFCDLGIDDKVPDHSAFTRARNERFRAHDVFRQVFERVVCACIKADLVGVRPHELHRRGAAGAIELLPAAGCAVRPCLVGGRIDAEAEQPQRHHDQARADSLPAEPGRPLQIVVLS